MPSVELLMARGGRRKNYGPYGPVPSIPTTFGERIKTTRCHWDMTQREFGKVLGVDHRTISRWEKPQQTDIKINSVLQKLIYLTELSYESWKNGIDWVIPEKPAILCDYMFPHGVQSKILVIPDDIDCGIFQIFPEVESDTQTWSYEKACLIIKEALDNGYCVGFFIK